MAIRLTLLKRWHLLKQPLMIWIIGIIGICGSDIAYITAVKYAPPAHVDFIDYLWPFLVILITGFFTQGTHHFSTYYCWISRVFRGIFITDRWKRFFRVAG